MRIPPSRAAERSGNCSGLRRQVGRLGDNDFEFDHHLLPDPIHIGQTRALMLHRFSKVEAVAHCSLHRTTMRLVKGMGDLGHRGTSQTHILSEYTREDQRLKF